MSDAQKRYGFDMPRLTRDEATELCVYHLRIACALFQLVPDDGNVSINAEIERVTKDALPCDREPMRAFVQTILVEYAKMKEEQGK